MKDTLINGISLSKRIEIDESRTVSFMGESLRVYGTPELIRDIEFTCVDLLDDHLDSGENSVGTRIAIDHMAATPMGMWVDITVTVKEVNGRLLTIDVNCVDSLDTVAKGDHQRFVIDVDKTAKRINEKLEKAGL